MDNFPEEVKRDYLSQVLHLENLAGVMKKEKDKSLQEGKELEREKAKQEKKDAIFELAAQGVLIGIIAKAERFTVERVNEIIRIEKG